MIPPDLLVKVPDYGSYAWYQPLMLVVFTPEWGEGPRRDLVLYSNNNTTSGAMRRIARDMHNLEVAS